MTAPLLQLADVRKRYNIGRPNEAEVLRQKFDAANSSAPDGSVTLPQDAYFLAPGESRTLTAQVTLPSDLSGTHYLFVVTGGPFEFIYTNNNSARSNPVSVTFVPPP